MKIALQIISQEIAQQLILENQELKIQLKKLMEELASLKREAASSNPNMEQADNGTSQKYKSRIITKIVNSPFKKNMSLQTYYPNQANNPTPVINEINFPSLIPDTTSFKEKLTFGTKQTMTPPVRQYIDYNYNLDIIEIGIFQIDKLTPLKTKLEELCSENPLENWHKHKTEIQITLKDQNSIILQLDAAK